MQRNNAVPKPTFRRFFYYAQSPYAGVVIGDILGGLILDRRLSIQPKNMLLGFVVSSIYALHRMEVEIAAQKQQYQR